MRAYHFYALHVGLRSNGGNSLGSVDFVCTRTLSPLVQRVYFYNAPAVVPLEEPLHWLIGLLQANFVRFLESMLLR